MDELWASRRLQRLAARASSGAVSSHINAAELPANRVAAALDSDR